MRTEVLSKSDGTVVCARCEVASGPLTRMRGLLGRASLGAGEGMLFRPAGSIHMFFMRFPIDAVFCDRELRVLGVERDLQPWKMAGRKGAKVVIELAAGAATGIELGDRLVLGKPSLAGVRSSARAIAAMCAGVEPQQPPTMRAPSVDVAAHVLGEQLRVRVVDDGVADDARHAGVRLHPERHGGRGGEELRHDRVGVVERAAAVRAECGDAERLDRRDDVRGLRPIIVWVPWSKLKERLSGRPLLALQEPSVAQSAFLEREERLEHEQVDAAVGERAPASGGSAFRRRTSRVSTPYGSTSWPVGAPSEPPDQVVAHRRARELGRADVQLGCPARERPVGEPRVVAPKVHVSTRSEPASAKRRCSSRTWSGRVEDPLLGRDARLDPHVLVVRPGRAVREQRTALGKQVGERRHRPRLRVRDALASFPPP